MGPPSTSIGSNRIPPRSTVRHQVRRTKEAPPISRIHREELPLPALVPVAAVSAYSSSWSVGGALRTLSGEESGEAWHAATIRAEATA
jgi:hypothetical protein